MIKSRKLFTFLFLSTLLSNADCAKMPSFTTVQTHKQYMPNQQQMYINTNEVNGVYLRQESIISKTIDCIKNYKDIYISHKNSEIAKIGKQKSKKVNGRAILTKTAEDKDKLKKEVYKFDKLSNLIINELELVRDYFGDYSGYLFPFLEKIEAGRMSGGVCLTFSSQNSLDIFYEYIKSTIQDAPSMTYFIFYLEDLCTQINSQRLYNIQDNILESKESEDTHKSGYNSLEHSLNEDHDLDISIYFDYGDVYTDITKKTENFLFMNDDFIEEEKDNITDKIIDEKLVKFFSDWINENSKRYDVDGGAYKSGDFTFFNLNYRMLLSEKIESSVAKKLSFAISPIIMCFLRAEIIPAEDYAEFEKQWIAITGHDYWNNVIQLLAPYASNGTRPLEQCDKVCKEKIYSSITLTLSDSLIKVE